MVNKTLMSTHCITALLLQHQLCDLVDYTDVLAETDCIKASQASSKENSRLSCCFPTSCIARNNGMKQRDFIEYDYQFTC
jgi:hypothetical protein